MGVSLAPCPRAGRSVAALGLSHALAVCLLRRREMVNAHRTCPLDKVTYV